MEILRNQIFLLFLSLLILLNYGFMVIRVPLLPGLEIPVTELVLIFYLSTINFRKLLPKLSIVAPLMPFMLWWGYGLCRMIVDSFTHGFWAFRDASHVLESLFLLVGFAFAANPVRMETFFQWLPKILMLACLYAFTYPLHDMLVPMSPKVPNALGVPTSVLFNYTNTYTLVLMSIFYLLIFMPHVWVERQKNVFAAVFLFAFTVFMFQARTIYTQIITVSTFLMFFRQHIFTQVLLLVSALLLVAGTVTILGLEIKGRLGQTVGPEFLWHHFMAIFGVEHSGLEGAASGISQRLLWWYGIYLKLTQSTTNMLLGLGYGEPLIDFGQVREPHNSYISLIARTGLVGTLFFAWMHMHLYAAWQKARHYCRKIGWYLGENRLLILMVYALLVWVGALGEDMFEKPFFVVPYYFFWGMALRFALHLQQGTLPIQAAPPTQQTLSPHITASVINQTLERQSDETPARS